MTWLAKAALHGHIVFEVTGHMRTAMLLSCRYCLYRSVPVYNLFVLDYQWCVLVCGGCGLTLCERERRK